MVALEMRFLVEGADKDDFEAILDDLTDELSDLEDAHSDLLDAAVFVSVEERTLTIAATASGESFDDAESVAQSCIRAAIHATGGATEDWNDAMDIQHKESTLLAR